MVVGRAESEEGEYRPFIARAGMPMFDLSSLDQVLRGPFGIATAINNLGQVVGYRQTPQHHKAARNRVFIYTDSVSPIWGPSAVKMAWRPRSTNPDRLPGTLGTEPHADYADHKAFLVTDGKMIVLGTLGGRLTTAVDLNNAGHVVGHALTNRGASHAFLHTGGSLIDLGTLPGGRQSAAHAINDSGHVVGASETAAGTQAAFVYSSGALRDLNTLIPASAGWQLAEARDINNAGTIVGVSMPQRSAAGFPVDLGAVEGGRGSVNPQPF